MTSNPPPAVPGTSLCSYAILGRKDLMHEDCQFG